MVEAKRLTDARMTMITEAINVSLYNEFGQERVDDAKAEAAYNRLMTLLEVPTLTVATTNYDLSGEAGLELGDRDVDTGFRGSPRRRRRLEVRGMIERRKPGVIPFLHLHGAVGWYEVDGAIYEYGGDERFNPTHGRPVVLYPDPKKDPTNDATVSALWQEFQVALARADRILVLGHSLHDPALVNALRLASRKTPLAVTHASAGGGARISKLLPKAHQIRLIFGPEPKGELKDLEAFLHQRAPGARRVATSAKK